MLPERKKRKKMYFIKVELVDLPQKLEVLDISDGGQNPPISVIALSFEHCRAPKCCVPDESLHESHCWPFPAFFVYSGHPPIYSFFSVCLKNESES